MKKLILFFSFTLFIFFTNANENKYSFEINYSSVGEKFYPRLIVGAEENFSPTSNLGIWTLIEIADIPHIPLEWKEKGYTLKNLYDLNLKIGMSYDLIYAKLIFGIGCYSNKSFFGPMLGFTFNKDRFNFQTFGLIATNTLDGYNSKNNNPAVYTGKFDPNSWYKIKLLYSVSNNVDIGIISERFYGTGLISEYNLSNSLKFKFMFGKDLEFSEKVFQFGLIFKI